MAIITTEIPGVSSATTPTTNPSAWRVGTVTDIRTEAPNLRSFCFSFETPVKHDAGQHYEIRLTSPDGYQAARLYSAAMPANGTSNMLELTIMLMPGGEVSPYLFDHVKEGSQLEIRGPLGRYFVWEPAQEGPVLLIGGGSGVVPLRAMRLAHQQAGSQVEMRLLYSARTYQSMAYKYEFFPATGEPAGDVTMTFTEQAPQGWQGYSKRIDKEIITKMLSLYRADPHVYICGPTPMVEAASQLLVAQGLDPGRISTERFGSTG